jgi:hypothetical protein
MDKNANILKKNPSSKTLGLTARITAILWVFIFLFFGIGYYLEGLQRHAGEAPKPPDKLGIVVVVSINIALAGLIVGWWREGLGGFISLFGFILAGILVIIDPLLDFNIIFFLLILLPTFLYLAYWWDNKKSTA